MDVRQDTALSDSDVAKEFVQFFVIADGELEMAGDDSCFLVVASCIASQLKDFSGKIFQHGGEVDGSAWHKVQNRVNDERI